VADLRQSSNVSSIIFQLFIWILALQLCSEEKQISKVLKDLSQRKGIDWPRAIWDRWISLEYFFGRNDDGQNSSLKRAE